MLSHTLHVEVFEVTDPATGATHRVEVRFNMREILGRLALKAIRNKCGTCGAPWAPVSLRRLKPEQNEELGRHIQRRTP